MDGGFRAEVGVTQSVLETALQRSWNDRWIDLKDKGELIYLVFWKEFGSLRPQMSDVTRLLEAAGRGEHDAEERLLNVVYAELHRMAEQRFASESPGHTLQPTVLVHEAWNHLVGGEGAVSFANRAHFFSAAAAAMRRILIDHARRKHAQKRGGAQEPLQLDSVDVAANADDGTLLRIDEALDKLAREDAPSAELVRLRFFVGLKNDEVAEVLGISERTAKRYWTFARAWLYDELRREGTSAG